LTLCEYQFEMSSAIMGEQTDESGDPKESAPGHFPPPFSAAHFACFARAAADAISDRRAAESFLLRLRTIATACGSFFFTGFFLVAFVIVLGA
jgi:hypothetical protein